uniref:Golgi transport 1A n=1 Tax=Oryzias latipes TaxID=8090 RepID=A0A3B3IMP7_ORYLA
MCNKNHLWQQIFVQQCSNRIVFESPPPFTFAEIGVGLMGFGLFFLLFGVLLYFDSVLLAFGNILFLAGLCFIIGIRRTAHFFFQRNKFRGTLFFLGGVTLVLFRWPVIGMLVESYGFVLLFRSFFPVAIGFVLSIVNLPFLSAFFKRAQGDQIFQFKLFLEFIPKLCRSKSKSLFFPISVRTLGTESRSMS